MPTLDEIQKLLNPADPSLTGILPIGTTVAGGLLNLNAAGDASQHQAAGVDAATSTVQNAGAQIPGITSATLDAQKKLLDPYSTAGTGALSQLSSGIADGSLTAPFSYDVNDLYNDPAYKFSLDEGQKQINAQAAARGIYDSGGTLKKLAEYNANVNNQFYNQDYSRAENTFNTNKNSRLKALQDLTGTGLTATGAEASDVGHAGDQNVQGVEWTATQISDLQQQKADALAAGDIEKADAINKTLTSVGKQISESSILKKILPKPSTPGITTPGALQQIQDEALQQTPYGLPNDYPNTNIDLSPVSESQGFINQYGGELAGAGAAGAAGIGALAGAGTAAEIGASAVLPAAAAASTGGIAGGGAIVSAADAAAGWSGEGLAASSVSGGSGAGSAVLSLLTNPITIGAGVAALAVIAWLKSQQHWEANTQVKDYQKPFDTSMTALQNGVQQSGNQMSPEQYAQIRQTAQAGIQKYLQTLDQRYREKGTDSDQGHVVAQAYQTFVQNYGPNGEGYLRQLDQFAQGAPQQQQAAPEQAQAYADPYANTGGYGDNSELMSL